MHNIKIGFIGGGNMAFAIAEGLIASNKILKSQITICEISSSRRDFLLNNGYDVVDDISMLKNNDIVFLAVKPNHAIEALNKFFTVGCQANAIVSIVAGIKTETIVKHSKCGIIRIMPNTPTLVNQGMFAIADDYTASAEYLKITQDLLTSLGEVSIVPSHLMDAVTAISGSGPAYVFMFIDAMISAGVRLGLTREQATQLTLQTVIGSATMVKESSCSPSDLKNMVCSPAGTTIEAVYALEKGGFNALIMDAIKKCEEKSKLLSLEK